MLGAEPSPAIEGRVEAEEEAEAEGHEERGHHRHHGTDSQAKLGLHHLDLACKTSPKCQQQFFNVSLLAV